MSEGYPSMTALLGLLAVAGYQNRDKIAEMLGMGHHEPAAGAAPAPAGASVGQAGGLGGLLSGLGGQGAGGFLSGGLSDLTKRFEDAGHGEAAQSWIGSGANQPIAPAQVESAIGSDVIDTLVQRTGLSREELLSRLSRELPQAVDRYTPDGRVPT